MRNRNTKYTIHICGYCYVKYYSVEKFIIILIVNVVRESIMLNNNRLRPIARCFKCNRGKCSVKSFSKSRSHTTTQHNNNKQQ